MTPRYSRTVDETVIHADPDAVYRAAADVERWPEFLAHYRWVTLHGEAGGRREVEMAARRGWIPVKWRSLQWFEPEQRRVYYRHIGGLTRGMEVEWRIQPERDAVRVVIIHDLRLRIPVVRSLPGRWVVASYFVGHIAGLTLAGIKQALEAEVAAR